MAKAATRKTPAEKPRAAKDRQFVTALARGLDILRAFTPRHPVLGNNEIAQRAHLPKPTVTRSSATSISRRGRSSRSRSSTAMS